MRQRSILIVEDNPITRKVVRLALGHEGYLVLEAGDAAEAQRIVEQTPPDLILQDLMLPDMDGFELVARLRTNINTVGIPIIAFSGFLSRLEHGRAAAAGFDDFLPKPIDPSYLVQLMKNYLPLEAEKENIGHRRRLLLVDDEPVQLKLARVLLENVGFEVVTAKDGVEALEILRRDPVGAVLSDVLMPRLDGFGLCAGVHADQELRHIPVVLYSSNYVEEADRQVAIDMGASALVVRTSDLAAAIRAVEAALEQPTQDPIIDPPPPVGDHYQRVLLQLDRQAAMNVTYALRFALHASVLSVLAGISETLIKSHNLDEALPDMLARLLDASGVSHGVLYFHNQETGDLLLKGSLGYDEVAIEGLRQFCGQPELFQDAVALRSPILLTAGCLDTPVTALLEGAEGNSVLLVPLVSEQECLGLLLLASRSRDLTESDWVPFARTIAVQIGQSLALNRAFARLRASESLYRRLVENAGEGIFTLDADRRIGDVNPAMERILGRSREELIGLSVSDLVAPEDLHEADESYVQLLKGTQVRVVGRRLLRADGQIAVCDISASMMEVEGIPMTIGVARDMTEKNRVEGQVRMLASMTLAASEAPNLEAALKVVLRMICEENDWCYGAAWLPGAKSLECAGWWTLDPLARDQFEPLTRTQFSQGEGMLGTVWQNAKLNRVCHMSELSLERCEAARSLGIREGLAVPVVEHDRVVAIVEFFYFTPAQDRGRTEALVVTAAAQLASIISRQHAESALKHSEEQLRQAQKMEAVGRLAGGVAHDFNNLLSIILSYSDLSIQELAPNDPMREDLGEVLKAGHRATELTRQLLLFSRQQVLEPKVLDLNDLLAEMDRMLQRLVGADVEMVWLPTSDLGNVRVDPGSIEQVVMNLVVNARDAMPKGGKLTLETANVCLDEDYARGHVGAQVGPHVMLAVTDTGDGMDKKTQSRIFEPFFTTKENGRGTGLGLSTVFGIVQASGGSIQVYSERDFGTVFKVYLPRVDAEPEGQAEPSISTTQRGTEIVLLAEDQDQVRTLAANILRKYGYTVLEASGPGQALLLSEQTEGRIDLLLTDVVMPQMSGPELSARLLAQRPEMKVLHMSGYTDDTIFRHGVLEAKFAYLQKPITPDSLTRKVREVLDAAP